MATSSARPANLDDFAAKSRAADEELQAHAKKLVALYNEFQSATDWGHFDAGSLLNGFGEYIGWNGVDARWVAHIAAMFRRAGGEGSISRLPDAAIEASLRAAGLGGDRRSVNFKDPIAFGFPPTSGYADDPVNTATGNFVVLEHDLPCGGLTELLSFDRAYNSLSDQIGAFGRGWSSWATTRLRPRPEGVEYAGPDGQRALFPRMGDGYGRVVGVNAVVEPLGSGLALSWFGGGRWEFDESGLPVRLQRGPGTEVRLRHDDGGRLVELSHPGGKHVQVAWDEDGERIVSVACSDGRSGSYRYDASGHLVQADAAIGTRRYEVDVEGRVVSVTDADGVVEVVNTYDDDGRVLEQLSPFGRRTHFSYLPGSVTVTSDDNDGPANTYIHDQSGRLLAAIDGDDQRLSINYDDWGNPVAVTERNGAVTVQEWDDRARVVRRVLPTGATFTFAYDDADRVVEVVASAGAVTRYSYAGDERSPAEIVDPEGAITRLTVEGGLVRRVVDPDGVTVDFEFDDDGNIIATTDADGNRDRLERDDAGRVTAAVTPLGRRTTYFYDADGRLVERHDPTGAAWRYEHTAAGRLTSVTDPTGAREEVRYGEHGDMAATVDALGHATTRDYDAFGNVVGIIAPDGAAWEYSYDALMRPTAIVDPTGGRWQREYDVNGKLIGTTDPVGAHYTAMLDGAGRVIGLDDGLTSSTFELDELGRTLAVGRPDGTQVRAEYDLCRRRTLIEDATGGITRLKHTPGGRLEREVSPSGRTQEFEHDTCGRVVARIDGAGRRWQFRYDADGALAEKKAPTGEVERFAYDEAGQMRSRSAPGLGTTRYAYDEAGRVVAITDRLAGTRRFDYDTAGRVVQATDANGEATRYAYNERGWLTHITDPLGGTVTRRYDAIGRLIDETDQLGRRETATYDAAGRLIERADGSGRKARRSYDFSGRLESFGPADDAPTTIEYDTLGRMVAINEPSSFSHKLRWDAESRLVERTRGDLAMRWSYNADGERASIGYPDGTDTTYTYDAGGYVIATDHPGLGGVALQRDAAGRLIGAHADGMRALWRYQDGDLVQYDMHAGDKRHEAQLARDALGRIAEATINGQTRRFAYDAAGQLVSAETPEELRAFSYDANGRLAREASESGVVTYEYDAAGQLISRAGADGAATRYEYDAAGHRVREASADLDRRYRWDDLGRLSGVDRTGGEDAASTHVRVDALGELAELNGQPLLWDTAHPFQPLTWNGEGAVLGEGSPWAIATGGAARWLAPDWQGTIGDAPRDPWGSAPTGADAVAIDIQLGYRGEIEFDGETWLRNRIYQPASRSFSQPDALAPTPGSATAANPYHYAANNPIGLADPLGLRPITDEQLQAIRDRMDRNVLDQAGDFVVDHAGDISAITGVAALVLSVTPLAPLSPALAGISMVTGGISSAKAFSEGDYVGGTIDLAATAVGGRGIVKGAEAVAERTAMRTTGAQMDRALALGRAADRVGLSGLGDRAYERVTELAPVWAGQGQRARELTESKELMDRGATGLAVGSSARSHAREDLAPREQIDEYERRERSLQRMHPPLLRPVAP